LLRTRTVDLDGSVLWLLLRGRKSYLHLMQYARGIGRGFEVVFIYIGTENVEINLARIAERVRAGGHDVPEVDVRRRYVRSFENLPIAAKRADHVLLFDNSTEEGYRLVGILARSKYRCFLRYHRGSLN
jgi:predicted ABC-type ATPase